MHRTPRKHSGFMLDTSGAGSVILIVRREVNAFATFGASLLFLISGLAAESEVEQREKLYQRFLSEMREKGGLTNLGLSRTDFDTPMIRQAFDRMIVHPSFGLRWDEVPAPTLLGTNAMAGVQAFIATNGWNMHTGNLTFTYGLDKPKAIRGLPWEAIRGREFPALTHRGILYVLSSGWHHDCSGLAYNPNTNAFPSAIRGFKHIGQHWYAWAQPEDPITLSQEYEGKKIGEPGGAANGSQPIRSETNSTSSAAGSRR
jgi:hypothetical protein